MNITQRNIIDDIQPIFFFLLNRINLILNLKINLKNK